MLAQDVLCEGHALHLHIVVAKFAIPSAHCHCLWLLPYHFTYLLLNARWNPRWDSRVPKANLVLVAFAEQIDVSKAKVAEFC